jgi:hypothetical protein
MKGLFNSLLRIRPPKPSVQCRRSGRPLIILIVPIMRLYHFLPAVHGLDDLRRARLKLGEIDELNDPFELWCSAQNDREIRRSFREWKKEMAKRYAMLCFSKNWRNPLLWSHYADRHRGICLGLDVNDGYVEPVQYVETRVPLRLPLTEETMKPLLYTKFAGWRYEEEWRAWLRLEERDPSSGNHCFRDFDENIRLREVIVGSLYGGSKDTIERVLQHCAHQIRIVKARLAFKSFEVVEDRRGFETES